MNLLEGISIAFENKENADHLLPWIMQMYTQKTQEGDYGKPTIKDLELCGVLHKALEIFDRED